MSYVEHLTLIISISAKNTSKLNIKQTEIFASQNILHKIFKIHSNLCTTTTLGTQKQWPLLTACSEVLYVIKVPIGNTKQWSLQTDGRKLRLGCIQKNFVFQSFMLTNVPTLHFFFEGRKRNQDKPSFPKIIRVANQKVLNSDVTKSVSKITKK